MCREVLPSLYTWSPIPKVTPPSILTCTLRSPLVVSPHAYTSYCVLYAPLVPHWSQSAAHFMEQSRSFTLGAYIP